MDQLIKYWLFIEAKTLKNHPINGNWIGFQVSAPGQGLPFLASTQLRWMEHLP
jgi:hypothetical protein